MEPIDLMKNLAAERLARATAPYIGARRDDAAGDAARSRLAKTEVELRAAEQESLPALLPAAGHSQHTA